MQAAYEVHNEPGPGFPEIICEEAMTRELTRRGMAAERQKKMKVHYKSEAIGDFILGNIENGRVILDCKFSTSQIFGLLPV